MPDPVVEDSVAAPDAVRVLWRRLAWALVAALASIGFLQWWLGGTGSARPEMQPSPVRGQDPAALDSMPWAGLPPGLVPVAGVIRLLPSHQPEAGDAAIVVQILADGSAVLRRSLPLARGPGLASPSASAAAIVLPTASIDRLSPRQRARLLQVIGVFRGERPIPPGAIVAPSLQGDGTELLRLLSWEP